MGWNVELKQISLGKAVTGEDGDTVGMALAKTNYNIGVLTAVSKISDLRLLNLRIGMGIPVSELWQDYGNEVLKIINHNAPLLGLDMSLEYDPDATIRQMTKHLNYFFELAQYRYLK